MTGNRGSNSSPSTEKSGPVLQVGRGTGRDRSPLPEQPLQTISRVYLLQFNHEMVTVSWFAVACSEQDGCRFFSLSILSINPGIRFYPVEMGETGERVDSRESQQNVGLAVSV